MGCDSKTVAFINTPAFMGHAIPSVVVAFSRTLVTISVNTTEFNFSPLSCDVDCGRCDVLQVLDSASSAITVAVQPSHVGGCSISIRNNQSIVIRSEVFVVSAANISSTDPSFGSALGGALVTVHGNGFDSLSHCVFGSFCEQLDAYLQDTAPLFEQSCSDHRMRLRCTRQLPCCIPNFLWRLCGAVVSITGVFPGRRARHN